jgi:hypothetical protein
VRTRRDEPSYLGRVRPFTFIAHKGLPPEVILSRHSRQRLERSRPQWKLSHDELAVLLIRCLLKCGLQEEEHLQCDGLSILRESAVRNQWLSD